MEVGPRPCAVTSRALMPLRSLLAHAADDSAASALARDGGQAFVSPSLRPYLVAAIADHAPDEPLIVAAGDDRSARDLAADLREWLAPRPVRFYPSRGVAYESHLAPPPHLVGLRVAALDALLAADEAPVVVASAVALSEKVPDPELRPRGRTLRRGDLVDLDELADVAELLPVERFHAVLDLAPERARVLVAAEEDVDPALDDLWQDVTAAFHDKDAHHLYASPDAVRAGLDARAHVHLTSVTGDYEAEFQAQAADTAARSVRDAEPELE